MKKLFNLLLMAVIFGFTAGCSGVSERGMGAVCLTLTPGEEWIHSFNLLVKNPPQIAVWLEDENGNYLETLYVTAKTAKEGWLANSGNRRVESLPVWIHQRNIKDETGSLMPSKENPVADTLTGATPQDALVLFFDLPADYSKAILKLEINHSTDFNDKWPENAEPGSEQWSGGEEGSGQPSLVYSALIILDESGSVEATLVGHGSPDGSSGEIYSGTKGFTTALEILETAKITW